LVKHILFYNALKLLFGTFWDKVWLFLVKTGWQPCCQNTVGIRVLRKAGWPARVAGPALLCVRVWGELQGGVSAGSTCCGAGAGW